MRPPLATPLTRLGSLSVAQFMRRYWQKRPVLLRRALPALQSPLSPERLFALAQRDDVESRLVTSFGGWRLRHGPFAAAALPARTRTRWTLLVQGVDRHDAAAHALLARFRFVPDARLDDLMVSYAADGGGVGPHVDSYDVFLVQAHGRRRWRIGRQRDLALVPGLPLAILVDFRPTHEWVLEPGDVLYLPPGVAHEGVALGECITCSVGFRAPRWQELVAPWHAWLEESARARGAYRDPDLRPTRAPARLPSAMVDAAYRALARRPTRDDAEATLLRTLSEPKPNVVFDRPARPLGVRAFAARARARGVALDLRTRLLYSRRRAAINGELLDGAATAALRRLADDRAIAGRAAASLADAQLARLHQWYVAGWLHLCRARRPMLELASAVNESAPQPGAPQRLPIGSRAELDAAVLAVLGATRRTVRCASADLSVFGLERRAAIDVLRALLVANRAHTVQLLVDDPAWIETRAARLKLLQRDFAHALQIRVADREDAVGGDRVLLGDDCHALQLREAPIAHGEAWLDQRGYAQPLLAAFTRRWDRAAHNVAVTPLGL